MRITAYVFTGSVLLEDTLVKKRINFKDLK
jgi:hypothetical protein